METVSIYPLATLRRGSAQRLCEARTASRAGLDVVPGSASGGQAAPYQAFRTAMSSVPPPKGQFALHSQTVQMVCHQFLAKVETARELRQTNRRIRYPDIDKRFFQLYWPAEALECRARAPRVADGPGPPVARVQARAARADGRVQTGLEGRP